MCTIEILYQHWWHSLFIFDFKTPFQYEHWGCSFEDIDIKGWNSKLFSHLNKKLSCFVTFKKILESFEKFILHDFYSKWTIAGCFFDKKDRCNSLRCKVKSVDNGINILLLFSKHRRKKCPRWVEKNTLHLLIIYIYINTLNVWVMVTVDCDWRKGLSYYHQQFFLPCTLKTTKL